MLLLFLIFEDVRLPLQRETQRLDRGADEADKNTNLAVPQGQSYVYCLFSRGRGRTHSYTGLRRQVAELSHATEAMALRVS